MRALATDSKTDVDVSVERGPKEDPIDRRILEGVGRLCGTFL